jgi:hypothetical protein
MFSDQSEQLMKGLMLKLYKTVTGSDTNIKIPRNKFVSWFMPGIPFSAEDFGFCQIGFTSRATADSSSNGVPLDAAQDIREKYHQAFMLSCLLNFIPEVPEPNNQASEFRDSEKMLQTMYATSQDTISSVWSDVLKYSRVIDLELSEAEKQKIEEKRNFLVAKKLDYFSKMAEYISAADDYYNLLNAAQSATGNDSESRRIVNEFATRSGLKIALMNAKYMEWEGLGFKNEYEKANGYLEQVAQKSMILYKTDLQRKFERAKLTSATDGGSDFYYTTLVPGNFATSPGWTRFSYSHGDYFSTYKNESKNWGLAGGIPIAPVAIGGSGERLSTQGNQNIDFGDFKATFEFTQIPILRPWFEPGFFAMRGWDLDRMWNLNYQNKPVSSGGEYPVGRLIAYPVIALFIRNLEFKASKFSAFNDWITQQTNAGLKVGWGPFSVGGKYQKGKSDTNVKNEMQEGSITIKGIQLIGVINNLIPKAPNLDPKIKPEQLVGGAEDKPEKRENNDNSLNSSPS